MLLMLQTRYIYITVNTLPHNFQDEDSIRQPMIAQHCALLCNN